MLLFLAPALEGSSCSKYQHVLLVIKIVLATQIPGHKEILVIAGKDVDLLIVQINSTPTFCDDVSFDPCPDPRQLTSTGVIGVLAAWDLSTLEYYQAGPDCASLAHLHESGKISTRPETKNGTRNQKWNQKQKPFMENLYKHWLKFVKKKLFVTIVLFRLYYPKQNWHRKPNGLTS